MFVFLIVLITLTLAQSCDENVSHKGKGLSLEEAKMWSQELISDFMTHDIYRHPLMRNLSQAEYPDHVFATKFFSQQVYAFARDFRSYLGLTMSKLKCCDDVRDNLNDHIREENGRLTQAELEHAEAFGIEAKLIAGSPHIELWHNMLSTLGIPKAFLPEVIELNDWTVQTCLRQSSTVGIVLVLAVELWAGSMGVEIIPALRKAAVDRELGIFFDLHALVDTEDHIAEIDSDLISLLTNQQPENTLEELKSFLNEFQDIRLRFWDRMHETMMAQPAKELPKPDDGPLCYGPRMCAALEEAKNEDGYDHSAAFHERIMNVFRSLRGMSS